MKDLRFAFRQLLKYRGFAATAMLTLTLGARSSEVHGLIVRQGMALTAVGMGVGLFSALAPTCCLSDLLYGVKATDPLTFIAVAFILAGVAFVACRRATRWIPGGAAARSDQGLTECAGAYFPGQNEFHEATECRR